MDEELIGYDPFDDDPETGAMDLVGQDDDLDELLGLVGFDDYQDWIEGDDDDDDDDYDDEIGARRRRRRRRRRRGLTPAQKRARYIAAKRRRGLVAAKAKNTAGRQIFFGGTATQGGTAGLLQITTKVQELCRVTRLYVVGDDGATPPVRLDSATWSVLDIKVGTKSQFTALVAVPGILFDSDNTSQFVGYEMDTVQPGTDFTVSIADAPAASRFKFAAVAKALR